MPVVTISRGSYSRGKEVAEALARIMGYECISRDIILEASEQFNIPELKLIRAIHDAPSVLDRFTYGKERYIAFFRAALLKHLQKDNVVYHGLAGHFFVQNIPHVLKVRIIADIEDRIREEMKLTNIPAHEARHILVKDDAERRKWGLQLYGKDTWNPILYDIVLHTNRINIGDAVSIIQGTLRRPCFQTTPKGRRLLDDQSLAAQVESVLIPEYPKVTADARNGEVIVNIRASLIDEKAISENVNRMTDKVDGLNAITVNIVPFVVED